MLRATRNRLSSLRSDRRGFTLIETLVAILTGVVVTGALFAILEVSLHQTARVNDVVQANQVGRGAMAHVTEELQSSCLTAGFAPVREASNASTLVLVSAYSANSVITSGEAFEHKVSWNSSTKKVTDSTYAVTGEYPHFTFPESTLLSSTILAENVTTGEEGGKAVPIFRYFKYAATPFGGVETPEGTLSEQAIVSGKLPGAAETAAVTVTFKVAPTDTTSFQGHVPVQFSNQSVLAFSSPGSESNVVDTPCE